MEKTIIVFTDGSFSKKWKTCGYGVHFPNNELKDISEPFNNYLKTSQRAELYAIYSALYNIQKYLKFSKIIIYTDSRYSLKSLTEWIHKWMKNGWMGTNNKPVKNKDIISDIYNIMDKISIDKIKFIHVKAHTLKKDPLSEGNRIADELATQGAIKKSNNKPYDSNLLKDKINNKLENKKENKKENKISNEDAILLEIVSNSILESKIKKNIIDVLSNSRTINPINPINPTKTTKITKTIKILDEPKKAKIRII